MIVKKSEFRLLGFEVMNSIIQQVPEPSDNNPADNFDNFKIDYDFNVLRLNDSTFMLVNQLKINEVKEPVPGYRIELDFATVFQFADLEKLEEKEINKFLINSGVSMTLGAIRGYLETVTSYMLFGKYSLPSIDMVDFNNRKYSESQEKDSSRSSSDN